MAQEPGSSLPLAALSGLARLFSFEQSENSEQEKESFQKDNGLFCRGLIHRSANLKHQNA